MPPKTLWDERIQTVGDKGLAAVADATIDRWFTKPGQQRLASEVEDVRAAILRTSPQGFSACCAAIRDMDLRSVLESIPVPTLILVGEHDQGTPVSMASAIHQAIPVARLVITRGAAHLQNIEQADAFNGALLDFLTENN
jgi:3-oxoadipate enol-lactonase